MSGYTISITGDSNDSDLLLGSSNGVITENTTANLTALETKTATLETKTATLETKTATLETSMNSVETKSTVLDTRITTVEDTTFTSDMTDPPVLFLMYEGSDFDTYNTGFTDLMNAITQKTGKPCEFKLASSKEDKLTAMRNGEGHIFGLQSGETAQTFVERHFETMATHGTDAGPDSYQSLIVTYKDSSLNTLDDLKDVSGLELNVSDRDSASGFKYPVTKIKEETGLVYDVDYTINELGGHHLVLFDVRDKVKLVGASASSTWDYGINNGLITADQYTILHTSPPIPRSAYGCINALKPSLKAQIKEAFLSLTDFSGTTLGAVWGNDLRFVEAKNSDYDIIADMDTTVGVTYGPRMSSRIDPALVNVETKTATLETSMNSLETKTATLETSMNSVESRVTSLEHSLDILETPIGGWRLTVFSHNDSESKYFFTKTPVDQNDTLRVPYGTMSRVASVQNKVRSHYEARGDYTLTIGTGDNIQATALNNSRENLDLPVTINGITYSQNVDSRNFPYDTVASASIGYDIYTLGNHELGFLGHRNIDQSSYDAFTFMCDSLSGSVHFLSANWQFNKTPLNSIVKKSAVVSKTIGSTTHNIGIIGLNNPSLGKLGVNTSSSDVSLTSLVSMVGLDQSYNELAALIDTEYDNCIAAGADIVFVTGHMYFSEFQTILPLTSKPITAFFSGGNEDYYSKNNISIKGDTPSFSLSPDIINSAGHAIKIPRENKGQYAYFGASTFAFDSSNNLVDFTQDTIPVIHSSLYTPSFPPNSSMKSANKTINAIISNSKLDGELWEESDFVMQTGDTPLYEIQYLLNKLSFNYDLPGLGTLYFETPSGETIYLNASLKHEKPLCRQQWTNLTILDNDVALYNLNIQATDDAATRRSKITTLGYSLIDNSFGHGLDLAGAVPIAMSSGASLRGSLDTGRVPQLVASLAKGYGNSWAVKLIQYAELKAILEISTDTLPGSASGNFMHFSAGMNSDTTKIPVDISVNISNSPGNRVTINRIGDLSGSDILSATYLLLGPGFQLSNGFDKMPDHGSDVSFNDFDISYQYDSGNYTVSMTNYGPPNGFANSWDDFMKWLATRSLNNPSTTVPNDYITEIIPGLNY